jgi:AcrR family transcriptional regulator
MLRPNQRTSAARKHREETVESFLDAAEKLLIEVGYAGITTRLLAAKANANQGLIHYYFGSLEEVFLKVLDRFTSRLIARQRQMYATDAPFLDKWRTAWRFQEEDLAAGYPKIWFELQAMAWNHPQMQARVAAVNAEWRGVLREAFARAMDEYGIEEPPLEALTSMTVTFCLGYMLERVSGIREGHDALLGWIEGWIEGLARRANDGVGRKQKKERARREPGAPAGPERRGGSRRRGHRVGGLRPG